MASTVASSLSVGISIYLLINWFEIPYGWAVLLVAVRAWLWAWTIDIRNLDVRIDAESFTGPCMLFSAKSTTLALSDIDPEKVFELLGVFSVEDSEGNEITGHYTYYSPEDQVILREFIRHLR